MVVPPKNHAVTYQGQNKTAVNEIPYPKMENPYTKKAINHGAIIKVIASNICGSDLHMLRGRAPLPNGTVLGHEVTGEIVEIGSDVEMVKVGDLVSVPLNVACGRCEMCKMGMTNACITTNPEMPGAAYGYSKMGKWQGGQAHYMMVPYADFNLLRFPNKEDAMKRIFDLALLSGVLPTAYDACFRANVCTGASVYIAGAGPVGVAAAACSFFLGAAHVFVGDVNPRRLESLKKMGCHTFDLSRISSCEEMQNQMMAKMNCKHVDVAIDCVGFECHGHGGECEQEHPNMVLDTCMELVRYGGSVSIPGVYLPEAESASSDPQARGRPGMRFGIAWQKGATMQMGQCPVAKYNCQLMKAILSDRLCVAKYMNMKVIRLEDAPQAYMQFSKGEPSKFIIDPHNMLQNCTPPRC